MGSSGRTADPRTDAIGTEGTHGQARVRRRRRLVGHRRGAGAARARDRRSTASRPAASVGGNWRYRNDNGMSSAYRSLHINTSRQLMEYRSLPDARGPAGLPEPLADRGVLRRVRRPLRLPRPDLVPHRGRQGRPAGRRRVRRDAAGARTSTATSASRRRAATPTSWSNGRRCRRDGGPRRDPSSAQSSGRGPARDASPPRRDQSQQGTLPSPEYRFPHRLLRLSRLNAAGRVAPCAPRSQALKPARSGARARLPGDARAQRTQSGPFSRQRGR